VYTKQEWDAYYDAMKGDDAIMEGEAGVVEEEEKAEAGADNEV